MALLTALADSWSSIYSGSAALRSVIGFAHLGGLLAGGGLAIAADRSTLLAARLGSDTMRREADRLAGIHGVVLVSFAVVIVSGFLLMLADLDAYLAAPAFWIKMGLVMLLVINGAVLRRAGRQAALGNAAAHGTLAGAARVSVGLWFTTTLAGAILPNVL